MSPSAQAGGGLASAPTSARREAPARGLPATPTSRPDLPLPADGRTVLVGEAPRFNSAEYPLFPYPRHCTGYRLAKLSGVSIFRYLRKFIRLNVFYEAPGESGRFPLTEAKMAAAAIVPHLVGRKVIFVGRRTASAFYADGTRICTWATLTTAHGPVTYAVIPHPSGRNRFYNDPQNVALVREFMKKAAEASPECDWRKAARP